MLSDNYIEVMVDESYLTAIFNDDYSGLNGSSECDLLDEFLKDYGSERGCFSSAVTERGEGLCEVSEYWSDRLAVLRFYLYDGKD